MLQGEGNCNPQLMRNGTMAYQTSGKNLASDSTLELKSGGHAPIGDLHNDKVPATLPGRFGFEDFGINGPEALDDLAGKVR